MTPGRSGALIAVIVAIAAGAVFVSRLGDGMRRTLLLTTADPRALGQVASESLEPIVVRLEADYLRGSEWTKAGSVKLRVPEVVKRRAEFRIGAAYVSLLDMKAGPRGETRFGLSVFSESFSPYRPVEMESNRLRLQGRSPEEQRAPYARYPGETLLYIELSNRWVRSGEQRHQEIEKLADIYVGMFGPFRRELGGDGLFMQLFAQEAVGGDKSESGGSSPKAYRPGAGYGLLRLNPDGSNRYLVRCDDGTPTEPPRRRAYCRVWGFFDGFPLYVLMDNMSAAKWDGWYDKVQDFLRANRATNTNDAILDDG